MRVFFQLPTQAELLESALGALDKRASVQNRPVCTYVHSNESISVDYERSKEDFYTQTSHKMRFVCR